MARSPTNGGNVPGVSGLAHFWTDGLLRRFKTAALNSATALPCPTTKVRECVSPCEHAFSIVSVAFQYAETFPIFPMVA
jgi:hypothetical protein